jgi:hypothetical protein
MCYTIIIKISTYINFLYTLLISTVVIRLSTLFISYTVMIKKNSLIADRS